MRVRCEAASWKASTRKAFPPNSCQNDARSLNTSSEPSGKHGPVWAKPMLATCEARSVRTYRYVCADFVRATYVVCSTLLDS